MKIFFILTISILVLSSCGKKSDPIYQGKKITEIIEIL